MPRTTSKVFAFVGGAGIISKEVAFRTEPAVASRRAVEIPESVLVTAQSLDDLEDWLAAQNPRFLARMRRIRDSEDLSQAGKDLSEILKRWPTKS